jgi:hypothetical protein
MRRGIEVGPADFQVDDFLPLPLHLSGGIQHEPDLGIWYALRLDRLHCRSSSPGNFNAARDKKQALFGKSTGNERLRLRQAHTGSQTFSLI